MIDFPLVDALIAGAVFISAIMGWVRGGTREILSVIALAGSVYITIYFMPPARDIARSYISHGLIADFSASCVLFILSITILSVINHCFSNFVKESVLRTADKVLGVTFGMVRAVAILAIVDFVLCQFILSGPQKYLEESKIRPFIVNISNFIVFILPDDIQDEIVSRMSQLKKQDLFDFIAKYISPDSAKGGANGVIAVPAPPPSDEIGNDSSKDDMPADGKKELTAEEIATLKPKKDSYEQRSGVRESRDNKKRKDLDRFLGTRSD
jgi:membrane protein required for colicin V production